MNDRDVRHIVAKLVLLKVGIDAKEEDARAYLPYKESLITNRDLDEARASLKREDSTKLYYSIADIEGQRLSNDELAKSLLMLPAGRAALRREMQQLSPTDLLEVLDFRRHSLSEADSAASVPCEVALA
jgi:hypothetical protein